MKTLLKYNLCSVYLLGLIGLSMYSFGGLENFVNAYVTPEGDRIVVRVQDLEFAEDVMVDCTFFDTLWVEKGNHYLIFRLPEIWQEDFLHFYAGEYTRFSVAAKEQIITFCQLPYHTQKEDGSSYTDLRLLAMSSDPEERKVVTNFYMSVYEANPVNSDTEVLWPPAAEEFIML